MVLQQSYDSCNTLVSLENNRKRGLSDFHEISSLDQQPSEYFKTQILLPSDHYDDDDDIYDDDDDDDEFYWMNCDDTTTTTTTSTSTSTATSVNSTKTPQHLYLPNNTKDTEAIDMCLRSIPQIVENADELLANPPRVFGSTLQQQQPQERILYAGQGEVIHATPDQCDILLSDRATTCHILAFQQKQQQQDNSNKSLFSMAHLDGDGYGNCILKMIMEHKRFAAHHKCNNTNQIPIDVHIMGGFEDDDGCSRKITNSLFRTLIEIAASEPTVSLTLRTCAVTSMNDTGHSCPIGRGLGMDLRDDSGTVFLAKVTDYELLGPVPELRAARLWTAAGNNNSHEDSLLVIHSWDANKITIPPFRYESFGKEARVLLRVDNGTLLRLTSTSPDVEEEEEYCHDFRKTLRFMNTVPEASCFQQNNTAPAYFRRVGNTNQWKWIRCYY